MKKKTIVRNIIIFLVIAAVAGGIIFFVFRNNAAAPVDVYPVSMLNSPYWDEGSNYQAVVTGGSLQNVELKDSLVEAINVKEGDSVKKGDLLMTYDKTSIRLTLDSDEASIALLESQIEKSLRTTEKYRMLQPSENAPEGWEEIVDNGPLKLKSTLTASDAKGDDLAFNCSIGTVIKLDFLKALRKNESFAVIELYDKEMMYGSIIIDGSEIPETVVTYEPYIWPEPTPTEEPTPEPTGEPTPEPTGEPTPEPTGEPTPEPTGEPTPEPTEEPTPEPTGEPTPEPTGEPTPEPTEGPTPEPTGEPTIAPEPTEEPSILPGINGTLYVGTAPGTESAEEPTSGAEPTGEPTPGAEPTGEPTPGAEPTGEPTSDPEPTEYPELYTKTEEDPLKDDWRIKDIVSYDGEEAKAKPDKEHKYYCTFEPCEPTEYERYETVYNDPEYDENSEDYMYTREELAKMIFEQEKETAALRVSLNEANVIYEADKLIGKTGEVTAAIDGVVSELRDPDECATGDTIMKIKGDEDFIITVYVSEMELGSVNPGDKYNVSSYESGNMFSVTVRDKGTEPANGSFGYGEVNPNNSWYPVNAVADDQDLELSVGEYCEAAPASGADEDMETPDGGLYLPVMYIRNDARGNYVMKSEGGVLARQYIRTGKTVWGYATEVKSGLSVSDYIAFPYGKTVKEGAPVKETEEVMN